MPVTLFAALERLMRLTSLCLLLSSWHSSAGFPYPFAAIARGPLAFATRWIWAADIAESIETAAVRAPLCLRFPLLLGSVQAGVGLLSPPPTRRWGFILRFSRVWRKLLQLLGLPPRRLPTLGGNRFSVADVYVPGSTASARGAIACSGA